jgi:glyoxylase-like metal-dependent hydrolase (beta-lactamase superfamily II)
MFEVTNVSASAAGTSYLITTKESALLYDAGLSFCAGATAANIRAALGGRGVGAGFGGSGEGGPGLAGRGTLDYILLTHSHFDHAAGAPLIARAFPEAKVVASKHAAYVFGRPGARAMIRDLDDAAARDEGKAPGKDMTAELRVDIAVDDGDAVSTRDGDICVYDTPGHTNDSLAYFLETESLLMTSESSGFMFGETVFSSFLSSYRDSLAAIDLIERIAPKYLIVPHAGLQTGEFVKAYPRLAREAVEEQVEFILARRREGVPTDDIVREFTKEYFEREIKGGGLQTVESFSANAEALVDRLIKESEAPDA